MKDENVLKMPEGVASTGMVADAAEAYMKAVIALPEILEDMADSLAMIALYCQKRGLNDGVMTDDDLETGNAEPTD